MRVRILGLAATALAAVLFCCGSARAGTIWTPLASGTTTNIAAVAAPSASEIVYAAGTTIEYDTTTGFKAATLTPTPALPLTALSMSTDGTIGVAVGQNGEIYRSADSGHTWTQVTGTKEYSTGNCASSSGWSGSGPLKDNLLSVDVAPASAGGATVYITGANDDILKSTNGGMTFVEVNKLATVQSDPTDANEGYCILDADPELTGTDWLSPTTGFFVSNQFGDVFRTTDGLGNSSGGSADLGESINGYNEQTQITVDAANPSLIWTVAGGGLSEGVAYTNNGGNTWQTVTFASSQTNTLLSIASVGTTVVAVGDQGDIWTSNNGVTFYQQDAPAPLDTAGWNTVAMVPGTNEAIVGGNNGDLVETAVANQIPDTVAPTGSVSGPSTLTAGQTATYTVSATDNPGGSGVNPSSYSCSADGQTQTGPTESFTFAVAGDYTISCAFADNSANQGTATYAVVVNAPTPVVVPPTPKPVVTPPRLPSGSSGVSTTTGGATVTIYRKVTITGRKGRYIPVKLHSKARRYFVVELLTVPKKHKRQLKLSTGRLTGTGTHTLKLAVPKKVHSGSYEIEVTIYTVGRHHVRTGRTIKQVFVLS